MSAPNPQHTPPATTTLKWCDGCGATDRVVHLRDSHRPTRIGNTEDQWDALRGPRGLCTGTVRTVVYRHPEVVLA